MRKYQNILFDLDGTIIDSKIGITNGVKHALKHFGFEIPPTEELYKFIGPPLREAFAKYYNLSKEDAEIATEKYREFYKVTGIKQNSLYQGIAQVIKGLKDNKRKILLATSKPETFAKQILADLKIAKYFDFVAGATFDGRRDKKGDIIKYAINETGISVEQSIMIGDRNHDIIGAKEVEMDSVGVLYGYGSLEELKNAGATYIVRNVEELMEKLI